MNKLVSLGVLISAKDTLSPKLKKANTSLSRFESKIKSAGASMAKFGAGSAAIGTAILAPMKSFYDDYTAIAKKEGELESLGISAKGIETITAASKKFSNQFARISAPEFLNAAYDIKSGISSLSDEGVAKMTAMSSMTAQATKASGEEMSKLFALGHGIFGKDFTSDFDFAEKFSAAIATSVQAFRTDGADLSLGLSNIGAAAKSMGVSLEEELAIIGVGKSVFNSASEAGTGYRAFLTGVGKAQEKLGLKFTDSHGKMLPMVEVLNKIKSKYKDLESVETKDSLTKAFGSEEATKLISGLIDKTDLLSKAQIDLSSNMKKGTAVTQEMAEKMNKGYGIELMINRLVNLTSTIGSKLQPMVEKFTSKIGNLAIKIGAWMEENKELASTIVAVGAGIGAALIGLGTFSITLGAIALITPTIISGFGLVTTAITILGKAFLLNPIGLAVTAIGLAAFGVYKYWEPISGFFSNLWSGIKSSFLSGVTAVNEFFTNLWTGVISGISSFWNKTKELFSIGFSFLSDFFSNLWSGIKSTFSAGITFIQDYLGWTPIGMIINNWNPLKEFFSSFWTGLKQLFLFGASIVTDIFTSIWHPLEEVLSSFWNKTKELFSTGVSFIREVFSNLWSGIKSGISSFWTGVENLFLTGVTFVSSVFSSISTAIKKPFEIVFLWLVEKFSWLESKVSKIITPVVGFFKETGNGIGNFFKDASSLFTLEGGYKKEKRSTNITAKEPIKINTNKRNLNSSQSVTIQKIEINNPTSTVDVQKGVASGLKSKPISLNDEEF